MKNFVILCGGYGTRFQKISKTIPKIIIDIKPSFTMLDWLIEEYLPNDSQIILATGYLHKKILEFIEKKWYKSKIIISHEENKLGTAGSIINASRLINTNDFVVLNGDTIQEIDIEDFIIKSELSGDVVINIGCTIKDMNDSGKIIVDSKNNILSFTEKEYFEDYLKTDYKLASNLGLYRCKTSFFKELEILPLSLENQLIPELVSRKKVKASLFLSGYHDFGTYARYNDLFN
tara:strand:+ start:134 stop:832 length:699 start_codon:yes stop_codon:yes gene_type:complete